MTLDESHFIFLILHFTGKLRGHRLPRRAVRRVQWANVCEGCPGCSQEPPSRRPWHYDSPHWRRPTDAFALTCANVWWGGGGGIRIIYQHLKARKSHIKAFISGRETSGHATGPASLSRQGNPCSAGGARPSLRPEAGLTHSEDPLGPRRS